MKKILLISILALLGMSQAVAQEYEYVPFVREGVKWVCFYNNSSDIPNPNVAPGKNYFILELKGDTTINGKTYKAMHKYSGFAINMANDTVPVYLREEDRIVYGIIPNGKQYADCPVGNIFAGDETFYSGHEFVLYDFVDPVTFWDVNFNDLLTVPAFTYQFTDMISLGNKYVRRYLWQETNTRNICQVEGVGSDVEMNGYTLYPYKDIQAFTDGEVRFYLSHMVEDGRIIHKGFHYDPDNMTGIDEVVADQRPCHYDGNYYDLTGRCMCFEVPTTPGIYIHNGNKICVSQMP